MKRRRAHSEKGADSWSDYLDRHPIVVAVAGPNGAGKSTFFESHLKSSGLRFVNADVVAGELETNPYEAARVAAALRAELIQQRESFIFETVFSDPVGDKLGFLKAAAKAGYAVAVCFVGISSASVSEERVAMRVSQGGHDVPSGKLRGRFPRVMANLQKAIRELPCVLIFDNDDLRRPFRLAAVFMNGEQVEGSEAVPEWLRTVV